MLICACRVDFFRKTGVSYALKVINKSKCLGKEEMIASEVEILRRIHHPNIVQLIAEYDFPQELYLLTEKVHVSYTFIHNYYLCSDLKD